jgi:hypothetical protein
MGGGGLGSLADCNTETRTSEQAMVDMIRQDLGVVIDPQAWRMFVRHRFDRISPLAHRIHDGKR